MKPYKHAKNSVKKYGGKVEDYLKIHNFFDQTKAYLPDMRHRALLHNSFGIFLCEQVFGEGIINSDGRHVSVRDLGEDHVLEDLGTIPTIQDFFKDLPLQDWHGGLPSKKRTIDLDKLSEQVQVPLSQEDIVKLLEQGRSAVDAVIDTASKHRKPRSDYFD